MLTILTVFSQLVLYDVLLCRFAVQLVLSVESSSFENHILSNLELKNFSITVSYFFLSSSEALVEDRTSSDSSSRRVGC